MSPLLKSEIELFRHFPKLKIAYFNGKNLLISFKLNFTRKTLGCYGLIPPKKYYRREKKYAASGFATVYLGWTSRYFMFAIRYRSSMALLCLAKNSEKMQPSKLTVYEEASLKSATLPVCAASCKNVQRFLSSS